MMCTKNTRWIKEYRKYAAILSATVFLVYEHSGFGKWSWAVSKQPGDVVGILERSV